MLHSWEDDAAWDALQKIRTHFCINIEEARALNYLLRISPNLLRDNPKEHEQLLRLINGLGSFVDAHAKDMA